MYNYKDKAFLLKNHLKSVLGSTHLQSLELRGKTWQWLSAGDPNARETVVLLHGLLMSKNHWRSVMPILAENYRVIALDVPGFKVGTLARDPELGFEGLANELSDFLAVVCDRPVHLVGHSMAAALSLGVALRMVLPVRSLTLVSLADTQVTKGVSAVTSAQNMSTFFAKLDENQHFEYVKSMFYQAPSSIRTLVRGSWQDVKRSRSAITALLRAMEKEISFIEQYSASLDMPILVVNGEQDLWYDLTKLTPLVSRKSVTRVELEACRHLPFIEQPTAFCKVLNQFFSRLPTGGYARGRMTPPDESVKPRETVSSEE